MMLDAFLISRLDNGEITWGKFNQQGEKVKSEIIDKISGIIK